MVSSSGGSNGPQTSSNRFSRHRLSSLAPLITKQKDDTRTADPKRPTNQSPTRHSPSIDNDTQQGNTPATRTGTAQISSSTRQRTLHRYRPGSKFGSLGKKSILSLDEASVGSCDAVEKSSVDGSSEDMAFLFRKEGQQLLYHGQVQTTIGLFRKKKEYLALTDTHFDKIQKSFQGARSLSNDIKSK